MDTDQSPPAANPAPNSRRATRAPHRLAPIARFAAALVVSVGLLYALARHASGDGGLERLAPNQMGLLVDHISGEVRVLERSGYHLYLPWLQEVLVFDRGARTLRLGPGSSDPAAVDVRARDGSTFAFTGIEFVVRPDPERLDQLAADFGQSFQGPTRFASSAARALLAAEFGRLKAQEAMDSQRLATGRAAAREALAERLASRGLLLEELTTPKPRLEREVERAIDERRLAQAEADRQRIELERAEERRPRRLEILASEQERDRIELEGEFRRTLLDTETKGKQRISQAQDAALLRQGEAQRRADDLVALANALGEAAERDATRLAAEAAAFEARGPLAVREALVETLSRTPIRISLTPTAPAAGGAK